MSESEKSPEHPACIPIEQLIARCDFTRTRRGGPGGQHRNKVSSAIVVQHRPSGIIAQASERRSQHQNRAVAIERLRLNLAIACRNPVSPAVPSQLWRSRCRDGAISVSPNHSDFPCLLAEALDWLVFKQFQVSAAADGLECSTSQLIKMLKSADSVMEWINRERKRLEMGPLK